MTALANARHERFAQGLAKGETADAAYIAAGYKPNRGNAATLKANQNIIDRVTELQERAAVKVELTIADLVTMLVEDRALARECEQSSAAVSASMGIAKLLGHLKDKVEHSGTVAVEDGRAAAKAEVDELFGAPRLVVNNG